MQCYEAVYCAYQEDVRCPANTFKWTLAYTAIDLAKNNESLINIPINY